MRETKSGLKVAEDCGCVLVMKDLMNLGRVLVKNPLCEKHCNECIRNKTAPPEIQKFLPSHEFHVNRGKMKEE